MERKIATGLIGLFLSLNSFSFCGFFVSKAGTDLFNDASKVVMARHENKTVLSMVNNFKGDLKEFAMVIPVPEILQKGQINVASNSLVEHLDNYTAPRLVEYHDMDPCFMELYEEEMAMEDSISADGAGAPRGGSPGLGVKIEAKYQVGEYDILILSAKESDGLVTWLNQNQYKMPKGAEDVVASYIKKGMKFFVAKVNMKEQSKLGFKFLRPLQVAYESNKFMLPIRLGMLNAKGPQDLFIFALTKKGRVETVNYKTKELPSNMEIPTYIKKDFSKFYTDMYSHQVKEDGMKSVWLEYAWDMSWCDPCAADPLSKEQLRQLGAFWQLKEGEPPKDEENFSFDPNFRQVYVTRLHVRYDKNNFPDDLQLQVTANKTNFQGRYILRHKWTGKATCDAGKNYLKNLPNVVSKEVSNLVRLTGWKRKDIEAKIDFKIPKFKESKSVKEWWHSIWNK